jgi:sulfate adenylyltransferase subunit 2
VGRLGQRGFDHLRALEAESIQILREVVAEFERPVMLYSIGKDSSVLLRLAQKAFYPGPIPFPLLHIDTTYKFREMIEFRDWYARAVGAGSSSTPTRRRSPRARSRLPSAPSAAAGCSRRRRCSTGSQAGSFDAAFGGARRDEERSRAKERVFSCATRTGSGTRSGSARSSGTC